MRTCAWSEGAARAVQMGRSLFWLTVGLVVETSGAEATTIGGAMGNASADGRPIVWKNRDGGAPTGSNRHFIRLVTGRTFDYLGIHPSDQDPRMGLSEIGMGFGNALAFPNDGGARFTDSPNYSYANNQAFKQFVLGETTSLEQVRQAIVDNTLGNADDWGQSMGIMPGIFDPLGKVSMWEIGDGELYEYNPENANRLAQLPYQIYARDNTVHTRTDHTDDFGHTDPRYTSPRNQLINGAERGGNSMADMFQVARIGEPGFDNLPSRDITSATMIAHGVLPGEDPHIATMWTALGQPDYAIFVPAWVAIGASLSPRVASNDLNTSLGGTGERLWAKRESGDYDQYLNALMAPMEANFVDAVAAARQRWLQHGFAQDEALRIHQEAAETAWQTLNVMAGGQGRNLNVTPELTALNAVVSGQTVSFGSVAVDPDGNIAGYDWDFGDGSGSTESSPVHAYAADGTYLVRVRVTDNEGARNSRWAYVSVGTGAVGLPLVTITATDPAAAEENANAGAFSITRTGSTAGDLLVSFVTSGPAVPGVDYQDIGTSVTIPAGQASVQVAVVPIEDTVDEGPEPVILTLSAGSGYVVGSPANAAVTIDDNETLRLFSEGDTWRYFKGTEFPGADWANLGFDDGSWLAGETGIGYADGDDNTVLDDMQGGYLTVYLRRGFNVEDPTAVTSLSLSVDYDDGFVAFLNGAEVARANVPVGQSDGTPASGNHEAGTPELFDLGGVGLAALRAGANVFAIEAHNTTLGSSDLSMIPELTANAAAGLCSDGLDNDGDGLTDFPADPGCEDESDASELSAGIACDDGLDNDGDSLFDFAADPGCSGPTDTTETSAEFVCDDGIDNDGDSLIDFAADPGCESQVDDSEENGAVVLDLVLASGADDAEERSDGSVTLTSSDLEILDYDAGPPHLAVAVRFSGVTIPRNASIGAAYVQFQAAQSGAGASAIVINGEAAGDAPAFTTQSGSIASRPRTTAGVLWEPAAWTAGASGPAERSADLGPILRELVAREDWAPGNAVVFILSGAGSRVATSHNANPDQGPTLHVEYAPEPTGNVAPAVSITAPAPGTRVVEGTALGFSATASDEDGDLSGGLAWTSSLDGSIGSGASISATLSLGTHTVTAEVSDSGGLVGSASVTVAVDPAPIDVPDVVGLTQTQAEATLDGAGLTLGNVTSEASDTVPEGQVIDQSPTACSACAAPDDPVDLVVSAGIANVPPAVSITAPAPGTRVVEGTALGFSATASDEDGDLSGGLAWTSSLDGSIGSGASISATLSLGTHTVTAEVSDSGGLLGSASVTVVVDPAPIDVPDVVGLTQTQAEATLDGAGLTLGNVTSEPSDTVPEGQVIDQTPTACSACAAPDDPVDLVVSAGPPPDTAPELTITAPADGASFSEADSITFSASASDAEEGDLSSAIVWSSNKDGVLGQGAAITATLSKGRHSITAAVSDASGLSASAETTVRIRRAR